MRRSALLTVVLLGLAGAPAASGADLASYVDPMVGTVPPGFVFPGAAVPFGMVQNSPDTLGPLAYSGYMATDALLQGFSLVHLSGPGVAKAGDLRFFPWVGPLAPPTDPTQYASPYQHATEHAEAGYYSVRVERAATNVELTASTHAAMQRYSFPPLLDSYLIVDPKHSMEGARDGGFTKTGPNEITGWTKGRYPVFFVARFSAPIAGVGPNWVKFAPGQTVTMRTGISFVDADGARRNLDAEAPASVSFEAMRAAARGAWNDELAKLRVGGGTELDKRSFYTALYHALLHPNVFTDVDGRYRGFDDTPHVATGRTQYANFSSWDTYKAENQLQALIEPGRYADMLRSLLADAREGGKLPRWAEENVDPAHMSGDPVIPMIADGYCRGLIGGTDATELYADAKHLVALRPDDWQQLGYDALDKHSSGAGTTLEYGGADFALALLADRLGHRAEAAKWLAQSLNYRRLLDGDGWIHPRMSDGSFSPNFDPAHDETGFQEGNSWQYSWLAPHDARGLFDRMGGDGVAVSRLDHLFELPPEVQTKLTAFGTQYKYDAYAPGNEHDLAAPYLYPFARQPWKTQRELRAVQSLFRPTADGLPGNDDLGSLSAWYVWTAIGFGPFTPGAPLYMVGSPQFERTTVDLGSRGRFEIEAPGASLAGKYVQSARLNGKPLSRAWFTDAAVRAHGTLRLAMGATPNKAWASGAHDVPPSASDSPLSRFACSPSG